MLCAPRDVDCSDDMDDINILTPSAWFYFGASKETTHLFGTAAFALTSSGMRTAGRFPLELRDNNAVMARQAIVLLSQKSRSLGLRAYEYCTT